MLPVLPVLPVLPALDASDGAPPALAWFGTSVVRSF
jgi:hypothetical protein